jgi:hypothetical protein
VKGPWPVRVIKAIIMSPNDRKPPNSDVSESVYNKEEPDKYAIARLNKV